MALQNKNTKFYSTLVFDERTMKQYLSESTYKSLVKTIEKGFSLPLDTANEIAAAMKDWALSKGATHFTHWFQPLSGTTSEKHDSFLVPQGDRGKAIFSFSGKDLIKGEPDASSLPSGGLRATFEARGYTAWDPTSNAFIKDEVLCIPTAFCSYNGEALDKKTPLLRSMSALKKQVKALNKLFGKKPKKVVINVGAEQEFFLIPEEDYAAREDLVMTGRTLFGNAPCKGQELEEHYFGSIRPSVNNYMKELDNELWALGISAHTKHNETAPSQHELAPIFSNANRAVDENLITMEKMKLLAPKYGFACLLHERPFEGINGSGKHCNWSITADGKNMLDGGEKISENLQFLTYLACIIRAVDDYQDLLRMTAASAGNDCRLGANEAPPAIVSVFLGDDLETAVDSAISGKPQDNKEKIKMDLGVAELPKISKDASDRNRTSPFAFTGNKFEFRMPGSEANLSDSVMVLNTAVAKSIKDFISEVKEECNQQGGKASLGKKDYEAVVLGLVSKIFKEHRRVVFNGNGYSKSWEKEAEERGLVNNTTTADALKCLTLDKNIELFEEMGVLSLIEIAGRYNIKLDKYNKLIRIEARVMRRMVKRTYIPAISAYAAEVASQLKAFKNAGTRVGLAHEKAVLDDLLDGLNKIYSSLNELVDVSKYANDIEDDQQKADYNACKVLPAMQQLRADVDAVEHITARDFWPVPSYNNMLFYV